MIGKTLGHYRILEKLGEGGMGVVYKAEDSRLGRYVALKFLPEELSRDRQALERFRREARAAAALNHPNICTIHEVGEAEGHAYIAMEWVEGQPLSARLAGRPLPTEQILRLGLQLADGLAHAHERGVMHRDFKSANVIITSEGRAKVLDFGLAKRLSDEELEVTRSQASLTRPGTLVGTLAYMAPEQLRGQPADARSDVWALGVVLYEMAAGARPFQGHTGFELSSAILNQSPPPLPSGVSAALQAVIERCLSKEPAGRYQRGGEVRAALEAIQSGAAVAPAAAWRCRLAVLPFENLSGDPQQEYFSDGLTEEMIAQLGRLQPQRLGVIARTSAMRYKKTDKPIDEIGRELGVDYLLEGSVRREASRVRITVQLIQVRDQTQLWADSYERELAGILALQSDVARGVAQSLALKLLPAEQSRLARARPVNPKAYEAYLKGRFHLYKHSREHLDIALDYFQFALDKDPNYALAYAGIADTWATRGGIGLIPPHEALAKGKAAALKALELDERLAQVHVTLGILKCYYEWDWVGCEAEFQRAIQLNPNDASAHCFYSDFLISVGRPQEALAEMERALELDPFNFFFRGFFGWHLVYLRRYDEAIAQLRETLRMEPNFSTAHLGLWGAFYQKRMYEDALAEAKNFFVVLGDQEIAEALASGSTEADYARAMRVAADELAARCNQTYVPTIRIARLYAHAGEKDRALEWLEKAYEQRHPTLIHIGVAWDWDILRDDPRFQGLLRRMNLPE